MEGVHDILSRAGIFQGVDPVAVTNLIEDLESVRYPRGATIFEEGEPGDRLYIITAGKVKLARHAPDGRENLLTVMGPSDMFGELSIFDPGPRTSSAVCVTEVHAATMNSEMLRKWIADHPEISEQLLRVLARRLRRTNSALADLIFTDVPGRVAKTLLQLANRFGTQEGGALRVNHDLPNWWGPRGKPSIRHLQPSHIGVGSAWKANRFSLLIRSIWPSAPGNKKFFHPTLTPQSWMNVLWGFGPLFGQVAQRHPGGLFGGSPKYRVDVVVDFVDKLFKRSVGAEFGLGSLELGEALLAAFDIPVGEAGHVETVGAVTGEEFHAGAAFF